MNSPPQGDEEHAVHPELYHASHDIQRKTNGGQPKADAAHSSQRVGDVEQVSLLVRNACEGCPTYPRSEPLVHHAWLLSHRQATTPPHRLRSLPRPARPRATVPPTGGVSRAQNRRSRLAGEQVGAAGLDLNLGIGVPHDGFDRLEARHDEIARHLVGLEEDKV